MMTHLPRGALAATLTTAVVTGVLTAGGPASAKDPEVIRQGSCSATSEWKLKAKRDDGRIEVEMEVDSNRNGQVWRVVLRDNGTPFFRGRRTTRAPSGSFSVERRTNNRAGDDVITGRAVHIATGEVCRARVVFRS